ncbi:MAG: hypothetical protein WCP77_18900, partial [Roseococcus sp.]
MTSKRTGAKAPGIELGPESADTDIQLVRGALAVVGELGLAIGGPLTIAPVWLAGVTRVSLADLARGGVIGVV